MIASMRYKQISIIIVVAALSACAQEPELLNSERIEQRFGSYGVEILSYEAGVRRSSLYSVHNNTQVCRTYAVVRFIDDNIASIADAHANVVAGQSIGATFKSAGWQINKVTIHIGSLTLSDTNHSIGQLMRLEQPAELAVHAYQFVLQKDDHEIDYATIIETHHPDYLSVEDLRGLYGKSLEADLSDDEIRNLSTLIMDMD